MPRGGGRLQALPRPREAYLVCVWPSCQKLACRLSTGHYLLAPLHPCSPCWTIPAASVTAPPLSPAHPAASGLERVPADYTAAWLGASPSAYGPSAVGSERRQCKCWESSRILSLLNSFWRPRATGKSSPLSPHGHCEGRVAMLWLLSHHMQALSRHLPSGLPTQPMLVSPTGLHPPPSDPTPQSTSQLSLPVLPQKHHPPGLIPSGGGCL